jgi:Family of unknown function (DUF5691)
VTDWDDLVSAALVGTARRPVQLQQTPVAVADIASRITSDDPAAVLLDLAALVTATRRAGGRALPSPSVSPPAPPEQQQPVGPLAASRLTSLLASNDPLLVGWWLHVAAQKGLRAPAAALPSLLDLAVARSGIAPDVVRVLGERGRWLAGHKHEWSVAISRSADAQAPDTEPWSNGLVDERRSWLIATRTYDAEAARRAVAEAWSSDGADLRGSWLDVLAHNLTLDDEEFLEVALDDRSAGVRTKAAELLSRLTGSALSQRMAGRAQQSLALQRIRLRQKIAVTPPSARDQAMIRDGVQESRPTKQGGVHAFWLEQILASTPLATWISYFGIDAAAIVGLPVDDNWGDLVREGFVQAARRQRDVDWARALLSGSPSASDLGRLLDVLPVDERDDVLATRLAGPDNEFGPALVALLAVCATPWSPRLSERVIDRLTTGVSPGSRGEIVRLAALAMPTSAASAVRDAATRAVEPSAADALAALEQLLTTRNQITEELA